MPSTREQKMRRYARLRELGFCVDCGSRPSGTHARCVACRNHVYDSVRMLREDPMRRKSYQERRKAGICVDCENPARIGKARCESCAQRQTKYYSVPTEYEKQKVVRAALRRERIERMLSLVAYLDKLDKIRRVA